MSALVQRRLTGPALRALVDLAPENPAVISDQQRQSLSTRFREVTGNEHVRLDAWRVERAGRPSGAFTWSPTTARRTLGRTALQRFTSSPPSTLADCVDQSLTDQLLRAAAGYARAGSLAGWLAAAPTAVIALTKAETLNWAIETLEVAQWTGGDWIIAPSDSYYDVAAARTTLRGRRDVVIHHGDSRVILRIRSGAPGKSAGPGLRADLVVDAFADPRGLCAVRMIGLWPDAGVSLSVDGTIDDLRAGARDFVRTAVVQQRLQLVSAA